MTPADDARTVLDDCPAINEWSQYAVSFEAWQAAQRLARFLSPQRPEAVVLKDGESGWMSNRLFAFEVRRQGPKLVVVKPNAAETMAYDLEERVKTYATQLDALRALACDLNDEYLTKRAEIERQIVEVEGART